MALKYSSSVAAQQTALNKQGANLKVDGLLGPLTQAAITQFAIPAAPVNQTLTQGQSYMGGTVNFDSSTGQRLAPGGTTTMTPSSLAPVQPFPTVTAPTSPNYPVSTLTTPDMLPTPQETQASGLNSQLGDLYSSLVGKSAYQTKENTAFGVDTAQANIQDLSAQLTGIKNEAAAIPLQLQQGAADRGVTTPQLGAQENSRLRTNAIAALGVSTLLAASQGQLANAQALADKAVAQKYDPILEQIAATQANLQLIMNDPLTSLADKNRAIAQQQKQDQLTQQTTLAKQSATEVWNIATTAAGNGNNFKPSSQYTNLATTLQAISQAPTKEAALQIAVETGLVQGTTSGGSQTTSIQEYEYAKANGYTGTYIQYQNQDANRKFTAAGGVSPIAAKTYKVASGDTFFTIAQKNGLKLDSLIAANSSADPNNLKVGQVINLPTSAPTASTMTSQAQQGDLQTLLTKYGIKSTADLTSAKLATIPLEDLLKIQAAIK